MAASRLFRIFQLLSRGLRATPLRHIVWVTRVHSRLFGALRRPSHVQFKGFTFKVDPRDQIIAKKLTLYGSFEDYLGDLLTSLAIPNTVVVDVGANIGIHTVPLAKRVRHQGRVIAFEPDPDNYALLTENLKINSIGNVTVHQLALSSKAGPALLYQNTMNRGAMSLHPDNVYTDDKILAPVKIQTARGDDILKTLQQQISLLKIDVEGAEPLVLEGLRKTCLSNPSAAIVFEFFPPLVANFDVDPLEFLEHFERRWGLRLSIIREDARRVQIASASAIWAEAKSASRELNLLAHQAPLSELPIPR